MRLDITYISKICHVSYGQPSIEHSWNLPLASTHLKRIAIKMWQ